MFAGRTAKAKFGLNEIDGRIRVGFQLGESFEIGFRPRTRSAPPAVFLIEPHNRHQFVEIERAGRFQKGFEFQRNIVSQNLAILLGGGGLNHERPSKGR